MTSAEQEVFDILKSSYVYNDPNGDRTFWMEYNDGTEGSWIYRWDWKDLRINGHRWRKSIWYDDKGKRLRVIYYD
jgi:hypothetical protein